MDKIVRLKSNERAEIFMETAAQKGVSPGVVEKDFWVTWVLGRIFASSSLSDIILFKGGTSLSKIFGLIERFSEDIDLIIDWNELGLEDPYKDRSKTKQDEFNKYVPEKSREYIRETVLPEVNEILGDICDSAVETNAPDVINIRYPASFNEAYLRPELRLELGPLAMWVPNERYKISPYVAEVFPDMFESPDCSVRAIVAERTFWEKVTILHAEYYRPESRPLPMRYSRHYYDVAMMGDNDALKSSALDRLDLLGSVVEFKNRFYPRGWARYALAQPGSVRLLPAKNKIKELRQDYKQMEVMFFSKPPEFSELLEKLQALENDINGFA